MRTRIGIHLAALGVLASGCSITINTPPGANPSASQPNVKSADRTTPAGSPPNPAPAAAPQPAAAAPSLFNAGTAVGGQSVRVDLASIRPDPGRGGTAFVYYLGSERIDAAANCAAGTWVTYPEGASHAPQSAATQSMLRAVCAGAQPSSPAPAAVSSSGVAIVFDPPSNIRATPNGAILCAVTSRGSIPIQGQTGDWYRTDYCGSPGYIHKDQVRF